MDAEATWGPRTVEEQRTESRGAGRADTEMALLSRLVLASHVPGERELVINARTTEGLQHTLVNLTVTILTRGPRHAVIYNLFETRV